MNLEYSGVRISDDSICEIDAGSIVLRIPKSDIDRVELIYGLLSERSLVQLSLGIVLTVIGLSPILHILEWLTQGGKLYKWEIFIIGFAAVGGWLIYGAIRKGYYLRVSTVSGKTRKINFSGAVDRNELQLFIEHLNEEHQLNVSSQV